MIIGGTQKGGAKSGRGRNMKSAWRMVITCATSWCTAAGAGVLFSAQTPKSEKEIPIIGGATRDAAAETELEEQSAGEQDPGIESAAAKVAAFYEQKLKIKPNTMFEGQAKTVITIQKMATVDE
jgi:hypothetical protein